MKEIKISKETARKYIDNYYSIIIPISLEIQPHFWEAVEELCINIDADVSTLIDNSKENCIKSFQLFTLYMSIKEFAKDVTTVTEYAQKIAQEIINNETKNYTNYEIFILEKRLEKLEHELNKLQFEYHNNIMNKKYTF